MAAIAVFATWMLERSVIRSGWRSPAAAIYIVLGIVSGVACIVATRGAMGALIVGLLLLVGFDGPRRSSSVPSARSCSHWS